MVQTTTPVATPEPARRAEEEKTESDSRPASKAEGDEKDVDETKTEERSKSKEDRCSEPRAISSEIEEESSISEKRTPREAESIRENPEAERIKELVTVEFGLEQQLEDVQRQLLALKQLPGEIENHLRIVSEQLRKIMELSGVRVLGNGSGQQRRDGGASGVTEIRFVIINSRDAQGGP